MHFLYNDNRPLGYLAELIDRSGWRIQCYTTLKIKLFACPYWPVAASLKVPGSQRVQVEAPATKSQDIKGSLGRTWTTVFIQVYIFSIYSILKHAAMLSKSYTRRIQPQTILTLYQTRSSERRSVLRLSPWLPRTRASCKVLFFSLTKASKGGYEKPDAAV